MMEVLGQEQAPRAGGVHGTRHPGRWRPSVHLRYAVVFTMAGGLIERIRAYADARYVSAPFIEL